MAAMELSGKGRFCGGAGLFRCLSDIIATSPATRLSWFQSHPGEMSFPQWLCAQLVAIGLLKKPGLKCLARVTGSCSPVFGLRPRVMGGDLST
jgi:hypothetical protein